MGKKIDREMLLELAKSLLQQVIADGKAWPCANLSLSIGGFEEGVTNTRGIGSFLVRGEDAKALENPARSNSATPDTDDGRPTKKRKLDGGLGISRFFQSESTLGSEDDDPLVDEPEIATSRPTEEADQESAQHRVQTDITTYFCSACQKDVPESDRTEHEDWHFAKSLQAEDRATTTGPSNSRPPGTSFLAVKRGGASRGRGRGAKPEKGQSRIAFGQ